MDEALFAEEDEDRQVSGRALLPIEEIAVLVGPDGPARPGEALARLRCPVPAELLVGFGR